MAAGIWEYEVGDIDFESIMSISKIRHDLVWSYRSSLSLSGMRWLHPM